MFGIGKKKDKNVMSPDQQKAQIIDDLDKILGGPHQFRNVFCGNNQKEEEFISYLVEGNAKEAVELFNKFACVKDKPLLTEEDVLKMIQKLKKTSE